MNSNEMVNALFGFNQSMNERLWKIVMQHLTDTQFGQADGYSRGSIRNQLVHMANAQYYWLRGLLKISGLPELRPEDYPTREAARAACQQADQEILDRMRVLSDADLGQIPDGWDQPVWVGLIQNALHAVDHRAQVLRKLHDFGAPTFEQSFVDYMEYLTPLTVREVVARIAEKRTEWDELLRQVPAEEMNQPVLEAWTVRDTVAVLTWKEQQVIETIRERTAREVSFGQLPQTEQASLLEASRALPLPELLEQHHKTHRTMLGAIQGLSDEVLNSDSFDGLPPDERLWKAIAGATWWSYPAFSKPLSKVVKENVRNLT